MRAVTIRNLPDETHRALVALATAHGRSTEAEIRAILEERVRPASRARVGSQLAAFGKRFKGLDLRATRDKAPLKPASFE